MSGAVPLPFEQLLATGETIVIDGGFATQCEAMGHDISGVLWSAELLRSDPDAVVAAHRAYLDAGARIIATASYQASRKACAEVGLDAAAADQLLLDSVALASRARDEFLADNPDAEVPLIAASIGPYGAALHDGSEYRGDYGIRIRALYDFHRSRIELFDSAGADVLACETIPSYMETQVLSELLQHVTTPAWISFCCHDGERLCDGTLVAAAADLFEAHPRVLAVGVNCMAPENTVALIRELRATLPGKPIIAYPNSGEDYDATGKRWSGAATDIDVSAVEGWIDAGAQLVGGCCRVGPAQIAAVVRSL